MIRRIHLISGLVMVAYVVMHLINHALGLVSLQAMEWALRRIVVPIWSLPPMRAALYTAILMHYSLALWALWQRQSLRLRFSEYLQLVLGFAIPILLVRHVLGTRLSDSFFGTDLSYYTVELRRLFVVSPARGNCNSWRWPSLGFTRCSACISGCVSDPGMRAIESWL